MRKILSLALVSVLLILTVFGCASGGTKDNSLKYIKDKKAFVMGLDETFVPMGFRDEKTNALVGFDVDLAKEVTKRMGVELKLQPIDWAAKEQELNTKKIDCIWNGFSITEERKKNLTFSQAYMDNNIALVVKPDSPVKALADMSGKKAGVQGGSSGSEAIDGNETFKKSLKEIVEYKDYLTALMDLEMGAVDAVVMDATMARYLIVQQGKSFRVVNEKLLPEEYAVGFRKDENALKAEVDKHLSAMAKDGKLAEISKKWFGDNVTKIK